MSNTLQQKLINYLLPFADKANIADVRIGLGYTTVRLDDGNIGLSWTAKRTTGGCTHETKAGTLGGRPAVELLMMLANITNPLARSIGLATANALIAALPRQQSSREDVLSIVNITLADHVAMVGYFGPLVPVLKQTGCKLEIIELESDHQGTLTPEEGRASLANCSVAILTATSIVTGTYDELLSDLGNPRAVVVLGPSSPLCSHVFAGTPVTHIAGARIRDAAAVEKIVSEGGGTQILKQYVDFEVISCNSTL